MLCFFNQIGRPDGNRAKRRKNRGGDTLVNNGTEGHSLKRRKNAMIRIHYPCQYKVRFGPGRNFQGNGLFLESVPSGGVRGGRQRQVDPGIKRKPNLEPSTGGFRE